MAKTLQYVIIAWLSAVLLLSGNSLAADDAAQATTQKAVPIADTPKPKVDVLASDLCKKCLCDKAQFQLDCSNKSMTTMFSDAEWDILQNGDFEFKIIKLEHNNITNVTKLRTYPVVDLYLGFNQIANIETAAFANLTNLTSLDLSYNKLTSKALNPNVFTGIYATDKWLPLGKLRQLDLGHNELHTLDPDQFEHVPDLETLILSGNTFQKINPNTEIAISSLLSLKSLDLSYMELNELTDTLLHAPRDLETLILSGNLFEELPDALDYANNLKELVLDENPVGDLVGEEVFPKLDNLEYLSMSAMTHLKVFGEGAFSKLPKLRILVASDNANLTTIDVKAFSSETVNPLILGYPPLKEIYLNNNKLSALDQKLLGRWDEVTHINLNYNPWNCDCGNEWLINILMPQINKTTPELIHATKCDSPSSWKDTTLLDIHAKNKLSCNGGGAGVIWATLLVFVLVGLPVSLGCFMLYRRGCFGLLNRRRSAADRAFYDRASFTDDVHI